ncbi:Nitroreductase [Malonomonas rubra DSM 5091]|uniref:Nitroreductase n=1 Tax=Malonomonas rubra DSM 5091 TaxID=1122189 RepID=A0A1M6FJB5_MALRU|nr:nitroreductase family protein [Malonomonas rubra]SHI97736.1 Nitroreductase [Malonomonas rubra DSM 5091]
MLTLLRQRRSIRKFTEKKIEAEKVDQLCEAILRAPTSRNFQPCEFVFVDEPGLLQKLATAKAHGTAFLQSATLAIVIAADPQKSDVWVEDCSIAAFTVQLAAEELGLKSCWAQLRLRPHKGEASASEYVRKLVDLPDGFEAPMVIGIGYPDEEKAGHSRESLPDVKIHRNSYRAN